MTENDTTVAPNNGTNSNNDGEENPPPPPAGGVMNSILRGILIYLGMSFYKNYKDTGQFFPPPGQPQQAAQTTATMAANDPLGEAGMKPLGVSPSGGSKNRAHTSSLSNSKITGKPSCIWNMGSEMDLHLYINDEEEFPVEWCHPGQLPEKEKESLLAEWHEPEIVLGGGKAKGKGASEVANHDHRTNITFPISTKVQFNESHIYAHACLVRSDSESENSNVNDSGDNTQDHDAFLTTVPLTKHKKRKRIRDEVDLLASTKTSDEVVSKTEKPIAADASPLTIASANRTTDTILLYLKPTLTLQQIDLSLAFNERRGIPKQIEKFIPWVNDTSHLYHPILYSSEFWITQDSLVEVNDTLPEGNVEINFQHMTFWKFQIMSQMEETWTRQAELGGDDDAGNDMFRTMLLDTNPYLLAVTAIVSLLHTVFDILAFKNDINFFKGKKSMEGLSLRSMIVNTAFQLVILLYLMDNDTSFMVIMSNGVGVAIEVWKISKAVKISLFDENGKLNLQWNETEVYAKSKSKEYDEIATDHLMFVTMPLVTGYALYSLLHQKHKSWYSWILNTLVGFIYMFGFVMMTPQLFINYKLQSVAHLNWRTLSYKSINTFIDDLFAFVIKMPIMHRLACLRDDIIFVIFCYQRYKYRTDFTRVNEYGQCEKPTDEMLQEKAAEESKSNDSPTDNSHSADKATVVKKKRRGAKDKR